MALLAIRPQLPLVDVGVAVLASLPDAGEDRLDVALDAGHRTVHAAQRIPRLIMIELRNRADRPPSAGRVAVLTRNVEIAVRTMRAPRSPSLCASRNSGKRQQHHRDQMEYPPDADMIRPLLGPLQH